MRSVCVATCLAAVGTHIAAGDPTETASPTPLRARLQDGVEAKVELAGGNGWQERIVYELFFVTDTSELSVGLPGDEDRVDVVTVFQVRLHDDSRAMRIQKCRLVDGVARCENIDGILERIPRSGKLVELAIPSQRVDWRVDFFRIFLQPGRYRLTPTNAAGDSARADARDSPAVDARILPTLADLERQYAEQRPFLRLRFSPLVRDQSEGGSTFHELAASFDGGIYRPSDDGNRMWQLKWDGDVATRKQLAFDRMAIEGAWGINLQRRDWLPLTLGAGAEADRDLNALDVSGIVRVRHVLPFNLNTQSGAYRPSHAPWVQVVVAGGYGAYRDGAPEAEEPFLRSGYDVQWRLPVAREAALRMHHAGIWNRVAGERTRWHALWDLRFETELGGVMYYVGYQRGEAAPLFQPTETTRVGLSFATTKPRGH